jgi:hypothetical protein
MASLFTPAEVDLDTYQKGVEPPFQYWEDDHTALVHVLWSVRRNGVMPASEDADAIATRIARSDWHSAVRAEGVLADGATGNAATSQAALRDVLQSLQDDSTLSGDVNVSDLATRIWRSRWLAAARHSGPLPY